MIDDDGSERADAAGAAEAAGATASAGAEGDAVEHLWNAAHEMLRAMRTLVDAADEFVESQRGGSPSPRRSRDAEPRSSARVHHINIDGRSETDSAPTDTGRF